MTYCAPPSRPHGEVLFLGMVYVEMAVAMVPSKITLRVLKAIALLSKQ